MKTKITFMFMVFAVMLGLQSCIDNHDHNPKLTVKSNDFDFNAINLTIDDGKLTASGGTTVTVNWTVNVTINGEITTVSGTKKSDELPVMAGNEIEIQFTPSCPEHTEAYFTMPDGTSYKTTVSAPSFKWTVPGNFVAGMQIKGETRYETDDCIYNKVGSITLVELN